MGKSLEEAWIELGLPMNMLSPLADCMDKDGLSLEDAWKVMNYAPKYMNGVKYKMQGSTFREGEYDLMLDKHSSKVRKQHASNRRMKEIIGG